VTFKKQLILVLRVIATIIIIVLFILINALEIYSMDDLIIIIDFFDRTDKKTQRLWLIVKLHRFFRKMWQK